MIGCVYLERGSPVVVRVQWGLRSRGETHGGPRNVLIERADGTLVVRPFRGLRRRTS
jgi:acetyl esterase